MTDLTTNPAQSIFEGVLNDLLLTGSDRIVKISGQEDFCIVISYMLKHASSYFHLYDCAIDGVISDAVPELFFSSLENYILKNKDLYIVTDRPNDKDVSSWANIVFKLKEAADSNPSIKVKLAGAKFKERLRLVLPNENQFAVADGKFILVMDPPGQSNPVGYFSFNQPEFANNLSKILVGIDSLGLDNFYD
jgi:hypothetical protein